MAGRYAAASSALEHDLVLRDRVMFQISLFAAFSEPSDDSIRLENVLALDAGGAVQGICKIISL
jgi:hypothetical protein